MSNPLLNLYLINNFINNSQSVNLNYKINNASNKPIRSPYNILIDLTISNVKALALINSNDLFNLLNSA